MFEDLKKSQRGGLPGSGRGMTGPLALLQVRDPKVRIGCLLFALVFIVGSMWSLHQYAQSDEAKTIEEAPAMGVSDVVDIETLTGPPALDMEMAGRISDRGPDARRRWEPEVIPYLIGQARSVPAVNAYRRNLIPLTQGSLDQIREDSRPWRFKFVRFRGPLEYMREEDYESVYGPADFEIGYVHRGRIRVPGTDPTMRVVFLAPAPPVWSDPNEETPRSEFKTLEDGWIRGRGILVKNFVDTSGEGEVPAVLVIATDVDRDYETVDVESLADVPLMEINDDPSRLAQSEEGRTILAKEYPRALFRLVRYAAERAGPEGAALRRKENLEPRHIDAAEGWDELTANPLQHRAEYISGLGAIAMEPFEYGPETIPANDAGVEACVNGWLVTDRRRLVQFVAPIQLGADWQVRDRIYFEGFFYKTKLYQARQGTEQLAPMMVLTVLRKVPLPKPDYTLQIVIAGAFVLGIAVLFVLVLKEDRTKESYRALQRKRRAETAQQS